MGMLRLTWEFFSTKPVVEVLGNISDIRKFVGGSVSFFWCVNGVLFYLSDLMLSIDTCIHRKVELY